MFSWYQEGGLQGGAREVTICNARVTSLIAMEISRITQLPALDHDYDRSDIFRIVMS